MHGEARRRGRETENQSEEYASSPVERDSHLDTSEMNFYSNFTEELALIIFHISIRRRRLYSTRISNYIAVIVIALPAVTIQLNLDAIYL